MRNEEQIRRKWEGTKVFPLFWMLKASWIISTNAFQQLFSELVSKIKSLMNSRYQFQVFFSLTFEWISNFLFMKLFCVLNINNNHRFYWRCYHASVKERWRRNEVVCIYHLCMSNKINGKYRIRNKDKHGMNVMFLLLLSVQK